MRSTPTVRPPRDRSMTEFRIRFSLRLANARVVSPDEPLHPVRVPPMTPVLVPPTDEPAPPPTDFWQTDAGRELSADRARMETVLASFLQGIAELKTDQTRRIEHWQQAAVELALTIATRLLHRSVAANEFPMENKVRDMLAQLEDDSPVAVRLNPADLALLESRLAGEPLLAGATDPRLIPDPSLPRGACRVEGKETMLLSDVERELQSIREELLGGLGYARP